MVTLEESRQSTLCDSRKHSPVIARRWQRLRGFLVRSYSDERRGRVRRETVAVPQPWIRDSWMGSEPKIRDGPVVAFPLNTANIGDASGSLGLGFGRFVAGISGGIVAFGIETSTRQCRERRNQCGKQKTDGSVLKIMAVSSFSSRKRGSSKGSASRCSRPWLGAVCCVSRAETGGLTS